MIKRILVVLSVSVLFSGCALTQISDSNLYWGSYSKTLYELKKNPSSETRATHMEELNSIITESNERNLKVPPGLYAELGMYLLNDGKKAKANEYFNLELKTYPESKTMISQILKKI